MYFYWLSKTVLGALTKCWDIKSNESDLCNQRILSLLWRRQVNSGMNPMIDVSTEEGTQEGFPEEEG